MRIMAVEDEAILLKQLTGRIHETLPEAEILAFDKTGAKGESVSFVLWISGLSPKLHTLQTETARSVPAFGMERKLSVYYRRKIWAVTDREVHL